MVSRRILLVAPSFHGYGRSIADALGRRGHDAVLYEYDLNGTRAGKIRHKLIHELPDRIAKQDFGARHAAQERTVAATEAVRHTNPHVVITVRGDVLGTNYWNALDDSGCQQVLWLYDELARMQFDESVLRSRPSVVSYSPSDVDMLRGRGLRVAHVPDAFDHTIRFTPIPSSDVVFVGARYENRTRILEGLHRRGVPVRAYGRDWSRHPIDLLRTWQWHRPDVPASRDVDRATAYGITAGAVAGINSHSDQDGFTMRTYELPGTGSLQLIDRPDVDLLYEPGREVLVFTNLDELEDLCRRASADRSWARGIAERGKVRTLAEHTFDHRIPMVEDAWD